MSFLTGAPRGATVTALCAGVALELASEGMGTLLRSRPAVADELAAVMSRRRHDSEAARQAASAAETTRTEESLPLAERIRNFFRRFS
jgi:CRP-like cAMP-binding protein